MSEDRPEGDRSGTVWTEMGRYAHLGFQLALSMGLFLFGGWWLDGKIGTTPLFTIVGAMVGAAVVGISATAVCDGAIVATMRLGAGSHAASKISRTQRSR